ncbi:endomembrane protein 70 [Trichuris suis]|nr:endomembrane protein 70 [Trichuris suis]
MAKRPLNVAMLLILLVMATKVNSFYLPGLYPVNFCEPDKETSTCKSHVPVFVNRLDSKNSVLTYEYHDFDFCLGPEKLETPFENLGQVLFGERIRPSPYEILFNKNQTCKTLCSKNYDSSNGADVRKVQALIHGIKMGYTHHWIVDNLPVTFCAFSGNSLCINGFPMGVTSTEQSSAENSNVFFLFNHIDFLIEYRDLSTDPNYFDNPIGGRIISVKATPSRQFSNFLILHSKKTTKTDVKWASRWDYILNLNVSSNIQWFGISNSILIILFLSTMIGIILLRTLRRDIARYNQFDNTVRGVNIFAATPKLTMLQDDVQEEFGWKLVHGDVFRPPKNCLLLSVFVGSGTQILCMTFVTLVFAFLGFVSPARRGSTMTCLVILYVFFGIVNGYVSARLYKAVGGIKWKLNVLLTCFLCPGIIFGLFFMCNVILWAKKSSTAVPFSTLCLLLFLWFGISLPLTFTGAYFGYRKPRPAYPVRTNQIPRQIPPQPTFARPFPATFMAGVLPFGCIYVQMFFIFNSLWAHQTYYMFGFLFSVFLILLVTLAETSVVLCYFQLCGEDYRWWWRAFLSSGFTAFYLFLYSIYFFFAKLTMTSAVSFVLYFSYCIIFVFIFFLLCGWPKGLIIGMEGNVKNAAVPVEAAQWPLINATEFSELRYDPTYGAYHFWANLRNNQVIMFNRDAAQLNGRMQEGNPQSIEQERPYGYDMTAPEPVGDQLVHEASNPPGFDHVLNEPCVTGQPFGTYPLSYPLSIPNMYSDPDITNIKSPISIMHEMQQKYQISIDFKMTTNQAKRNEHYCTLYLTSCDMEVYAFGCGYRAAVAKQQAAAHMILRLVESSILNLYFFPSSYFNMDGTIYFGFDSVVLKRRLSFKKCSMKKAQVVPLQLSFDITAKIVNNLLLTVCSYRKGQNTFFYVSQAEQSCWDQYRRGQTGAAIYVAQLTLLDFRFALLEGNAGIKLNEARRRCIASTT